MWNGANRERRYCGTKRCDVAMMYVVAVVVSLSAAVVHAPNLISSGSREWGVGRTWDSTRGGRACTLFRLGSREWGELGIPRSSDWNRGSGENLGFHEVQM